MPDRDRQTERKREGEGERERAVELGSIRGGFGGRGESTPAPTATPAATAAAFRGCCFLSLAYSFHFTLFRSHVRTLAAEQHLPETNKKQKNKKQKKKQKIKQQQQQQQNSGSSRRSDAELGSNFSLVSVANG